MIQGMDERVEYIVQNSGMSRRELAKRCGVSKNTFQINRWYEGTNYSATTIVKLCSVTGASADYILGLSNEPYRKR